MTDEIAAKRRELARLAKKAREATQLRNRTIAELHNLGVSLRAIGAAAHLSHVAVLKIVRLAENNDGADNNAC